ncbi:MAG: glycosyltransferase, partial [Bacteroidales bacterium]
MIPESNSYVTVLMSVYNASPYLRESIESILSQTYPHFEFLIINDASTDNSSQIIKSYTDNRICLIENIHNLGLNESLNKGLRQARGQYIARMDADDIALPQRLERQVNFLENNPDYGLVGSYMQLLSSKQLVKVPTSDEAIRTVMLFHNPFVHPSVMIRKAVLDRYHLWYDETLLAAEDEDLWFRIAQHCKVANLPEVLLLYRIHSQQVSIAKKTTQQTTSRLIKVKKIRHFMPIDNHLNINFYQQW